MNRIGRTLLLALVLAACADDDDTVDTLDPLDNGGSPATDVTTDGSPADTQSGGVASDSSAPFEAAGRGAVTIQVRLAATGLDETLTIDLGTIPAGQLDPISLFASCTALDGLGAGDGEGYAVRVIDLRRLTTDSELVAAALVVEDPVEAPGEYDATLELSDVTQASTTYTGTLILDQGMSTGTFQVVDERGNGAAGSFSCVLPPPTTTTASAPAGATTTAPSPATTAATMDPSSTAATAVASTTSVAIATTTVAETVSPPGT